MSCRLRPSVLHAPVVLWLPVDLVEWSIEMPEFREWSEMSFFQSPEVVEWEVQSEQLVRMLRRRPRPVPATTARRVVRRTSGLVERYCLYFRKALIGIPITVANIPLWYPRRITYVKQAKQSHETNTSSIIIFERYRYTYCMKLHWWQPFHTTRCADATSVLVNTGITQHKGRGQTSKRSYTV